MKAEGIMDMPQEVFVYSQILGLSGTQGTLIAIRSEGYYELRLVSKGRPHLALLPVTQTGLVAVEPEPEIAMESAIER